VERNAVVGRLEDEGHAERKERERRATRRASELKAALKENLGIRRLATNPMLLSIIALVHRSLATLPKERAKLYSECIKILLEQWDISKGVRVDDTNLKLEQKEVVMRRLDPEIIPSGSGNIRCLS
jgi:predicted NACHT family NTPase